MEFNKATLASGVYDVTQIFDASGIKVNIALNDLVANKAYLIPEQSGKVTVAGDKITFSGLSVMVESRNIMLSGNYTVK